MPMAMDAVPLTSASCNWEERGSIERPRVGPRALGLVAALALTALLSLLILPGPARWGGVQPQGIDAALERRSPHTGGSVQSLGARLWESSGSQGTGARGVPLAVLRESRPIESSTADLGVEALERRPVRGLLQAVAPQEASAWAAPPPKPTPKPKPTAGGDLPAASQQSAVPKVARAAPPASPAAPPAVPAMASQSTALLPSPATAPTPALTPAPSSAPTPTLTPASTTRPTPCLVFEGWRLAPATAGSGAYGAFSWEACLDFCVADKDCRQVAFSKEGRTCQPGSKVSFADVDDLGGRNLAFVSAHCPDGGASVQIDAAQASTWSAQGSHGDAVQAPQVPANAVPPPETSSQPSETSSPPPETSSRATIMTQQLAGSSLFCVTLFAPGQGDLVRGHKAAGVGVFGCDDYALYSSSAVELGDADVRVLGVDPEALQSLSRPASAGDVFVALWHAIVADGAFRAQDWTVRSDPDCLLLPERLRGVIRERALEGASRSVSLRTSLVACPELSWAPLEVLSSAAVEAVERCGAACGPGGAGRYGGLQVSLGAAQVVVERRGDLLGAGGCVGADSPDAHRCSSRAAAFHPQDSTAELQECLQEARAADAALPMTPDNAAQYERTWRQ